MGTKKSFDHARYENEIEFSKYVSKLKNAGKKYDMHQTISFEASSITFGR